MKKKVALLILDGLGYGQNDRSNAVYIAKTPFLDHLLATYPNAKLEASGMAVGLPEGQMGNSEVGHMNLGAGRVVYQELGRIHKAVQDKEFLSHPVLTEAFGYARSNGKKVHLIGLLSDGGVHAHTSHLKGLCESAGFHGLRNQDVFIHAFLDGRDTDPTSGAAYIRDLDGFLAGSTGSLASMIGRYFAMDRDNRWERVKKAYDLLVHGQGKPATDLEAAVLESYAQGITDEFLEPVVRVDEAGKPIALIRDGDVVICFNFRTDRGREITQALSQQDFPEYGMRALDLRYITMTAYDETFKGVQILFGKENLSNTLGETLEKAGKTQTRIAETEKYPHVTFFFSGGREIPFEGENRLLIPSPKVATYDLQPGMSAQGIADAITQYMRESNPDFVCLNFANPDMVGHTGVLPAVIEAVETVDNCLQQVVKTGLEQDYSFVILADHGNAEYMENPDGSPHTAHTTNLVPVIVMDKDIHTVKDGKLGDIAPTILRLMDVPVPAEMTGNVLVS